MAFTLDGFNHFFTGPQYGGQVGQEGLLPMNPRQSGLLALAGGLLEAGGPQMAPTSMGQGLGRGLQAMRAAQGRAQDAMMRRQMMGAQLARQQREDARAEMERKRANPPAGSRQQPPATPGGLATTAEQQGYSLEEAVAHLAQLWDRSEAEVWRLLDSRRPPR